MKSRHTVALLTSALFLIPTLALGAEGDVTVKSVVATFTSTIVQATMGLFIAVAGAAFFYGVFRYIWGIREGDETRVKAGNQFMLWGLIALFVMTSAWGIVNYAQGIFGLDTSRTIVIPNSNLR
ncbi:MAG: hypothetical protein ACAH17_01170 [Candidatus Paceibacterota bacterium]